MYMHNVCQVCFEKRSEMIYVVLLIGVVYFVNNARKETGAQ